MMWDLPIKVNIDGIEHNIRNKCDYRVILDAIEALNDVDLEEELRLYCAMYIFYEDVENIKNVEKATLEMLNIMNNTNEETSDKKNNPTNSPKLVDWKKDFNIIAPAINRVLGYEIRMPDVYVHWHTFCGAYTEIGDCLFNNVLSIRSKRAKGKKLEKSEVEFYMSNREMIDLPCRLSEEEEKWLNENYGGEIEWL